MRASAAEARLHWTVAAAVLVLVLTGAVMYVPMLSEVVQRRFWIRTAHLLAAAVTALAPLVMAFSQPTRAAALERELSRWDATDLAWFARPFRVLLRRSSLDAGHLSSDRRFNGGQRLFAALVAVALAALLVSGVPMYWWSWFSAALVERSRDLHVVAAFVLVGLLAGHVYLALISPYGLIQNRLDSRRWKAAHRGR